MALGNRALFDETLGTRSSEFSPSAHALRAEGQTVDVRRGRRQAGGLLGVADPIKAITPEAIRELHAEGMRIVMLTGDSETTAEAVARKLGIDEVVAEVLPDRKAEVVKQLQERGAHRRDGGRRHQRRPGARAGARRHRDGHGHRRRDGERRRHAGEGRPARHRARAAPSRAHDAQHPAEPVLRVRLQRGSACRSPPGVLYPFFGLLLTPMIAAAAMSFSSVSVIGNALRLRRAEP